MPKVFFLGATNYLSLSTSNTGMLEQCLFAFGSGSYFFNYSGYSGDNWMALTFSGYNISWYGTGHYGDSQGPQLNDNGQKYYYWAIG